MKKIFPLLLAPLLLLSGCAQKETSSAQNNTVGDMTIALDTLGETPAFADGTIDGQPMQVIAVRDSDGTVRLSYNTCQVCQGSPWAYFELQNGQLVCPELRQRFFPFRYRQRRLRLHAADGARLYADGYERRHSARHACASQRCV